MADLGSKWKTKIDFPIFSTDTSSQFSVDIVEVTPTSQNMELKEQIINETNRKEIVLNASRLQVESEKWKSNSKKQYYKLWYNNKKVYYFLVCKKLKIQHHNSSLTDLQYSPSSTQMRWARVGEFFSSANKSRKCSSMSSTIASHYKEITQK